MKKIIVVMLALASTRQGFAQAERNSTLTSKSDQLFSPDPSLLKHQFTIALTQGNKVIVGVPYLKTLQLLGNIDSILMKALQDLQPLRDSLQTETNNKRVDYVVDTNGNKKVRIKDYPPSASTYVIKGSDISELKTGQDTINIIGMITDVRAKYFKDENNMYHRSDKQLYWQLTFVVNNVNDIHTYLNGTLNKSMQQIITDYVTQDVLDAKKEKEVVYRSATYYPYENKKPETSYRTTAFIELPYLRAGIQTFGNTVAPSLSVGFSFGMKRNNISHYFTYSWEPVFFFERGLKGNLSQYRNDFMTLQYMRLNSATANNLDLYNAWSLSYLKNNNRRGEYFEKNTFKLGVPGIKYKFLSIQPQFVFNNFFKNVSPGFKVNIGF